MHNEAISATQLYRKYRERRITPVRPSSFGVLSTALDQSDYGSTLSEQVYGRYKKSRRMDREARIGAILHRINHEQANSTEGEDQYKITDESRVDVNGKTQNGVVEYVTGLSMFSFLKSFGLPSLGMAATVVSAGLLVFAILFQPDRDTNDLYLPPDSISMHALELADYIDNTDVQSFGFSSGKSAEKSAFNRGVLAANLDVSTEAGNYAARLRALQGVIKLATIEGASDVLKEAEDMVQMLSDSASGATKDQLPGSIDTQPTGSIELSRQMIAIKSYLQFTDQESVNRVWFRQGYALQLIAVAAFLQQETGVTEPLYDSLAFLKNHDIAEALPASRMIATLQDIDLEASVMDSSVRTIIATIRDIKTVMQ